MKIMISVGEASGDLNGAGVARALKKLDPDITLLGMGGQAMRAAGVEIVYDIAGLGVIGIVEILRNLRRLFALRDFLTDLMRREKPDVLVVIDYPGFNMKLAKEAKKLNIPVVSYISPSAWAWGKGRAKSTAAVVDRIAAIFPFEAEVYREAGAAVTFVGHPLLDIVKPSMTKQAAYEFFGADPEKPIILLMPGSRQQEIEKLLPDMLAAAEIITHSLPDSQFFLPLASTIDEARITAHFPQNALNIQITHEHTYDLMNISKLAIASSGTATLETALMSVPTVIIYRVNWLTYFVGRRVVTIPHVGLPNIVAGRLIEPELLQGEVSGISIAQKALNWLLDEEQRQKVLADLAEVKVKLGEPGAVERTASVILEVAAQSGGTL